MKRMFLIAFIAFMSVAYVETGQAEEVSDYTPEVRYILPKDESTVNLEGSKNLTFEWKPTPIPANNRASYRFEMFRDFGYERLVNTELSPQAFSIEVPAGIFENGGTYTWQVRQRDEWTRNWSEARRWSFKVLK